MTRSLCIALVVSLVVLSGCSDPAVTHDGRTVSQVCDVTAELLGVNRALVTPTTSLGDLGADDLDVVELILELEVYFDVSIPDDALASAAGGNPIDLHQITMAKLAQIVDGQRR